MDVTISAGFSGRPYDLRMRIYTIENNYGGNYSRYHGDRYGYSRSGYGSFANNAYTVNSWIAGWHMGGAYSLPFAPGDFAGKTISFGGYDTGAIYHDGNGNMNFSSRIQMLNASVFGSADTGDVGMWGDRLPMAPGAPGQPSISNSTPTSVTLSWGAASRGRADITNYRWQILNAAGTAVVADVTLGVTLSDNTADNVTLSPGNAYQARVLAVNGDGSGPWSSLTPFSTLPSVAPGMTVTPTVSGQGAAIALTPPGGATGVTKYTVERKRPDNVVESAETTTSPLNWTGLTPGQVNQWRASAWFGTYQSPWTGWVPVGQPNPNTSPGDYFDGATAARPDLTFAWTGPANNSTSTASGVVPDGWAYNARPGNSLRLQRVTGGRSGSFFGRMHVITDAAGAGCGIGMRSNAGVDSAVVEENATYVGSIYVRPSRAQRLRAEIEWTDAAGVVVGVAAIGPEVLVTNLAGWTRLTAVGVTPVGARRAVVKAYDTTGTGWVAWKSGEWLDADDVMVSLSTLFDWFSGDSVDTHEYNFAWLGTPNASPSARFENVVSQADPLADPDCPPLPTPPALPTILSDCIEEVGTWRRYTLQIPSAEVRLWSPTLPTLILTTQGDAERQVRIRYYANPLGLPAEQITLDGWEAEQILTYIPPNTEITLDGVVRRVRASVNGGAPISANRLLYGTGGIPAIWPELRCGVGYVVTLDVPLDAPAGNLDARVVVTQRM